MADELSALGDRRRRTFKVGASNHRNALGELSASGNLSEQPCLRPLPTRDPLPDERAIFESLVGKSRSARLRGNHLDPADSLFSSGASSVPAPGNALSTKPQSSRIRDQDLISSMSSRLRTLERQLNLANEACVEKDKTIGSLRRQIKHLELEKSISTDITSNVKPLSLELERLKKQIHEMEAFLADYGMVWVGTDDASMSDHEFDEEESTLKQDDSQAALNKIDQHDDSTQLLADKDEGSSSFTVDFDKVLHNLQDLNALAGEDVADFVKSDDGNVIRLERKSPVPLKLYSNGFILFSGPFRPYTDGTAQMFMRDLMDGYFPWELKERFPTGVPFRVEDHRSEYYKRQGIKSFPGVGVLLGGKASQSRLLEGVTSVIEDLERAQHCTDADHGSLSVLPTATTRNLSLTKQSTKEKPEETKKDTDRFLSRLPPAVVVNGVVVDIRGAISSQISPSTDQKPRQNIELVSTPVATLLSNHAAQLDARPSNACNYRPQTPLDIATIQVRIVGSLRRLILKMRYRDTVGDIRRQITKHDSSLKEFRIRRTVPRSAVEDDSMTLEDAQLVPNATLHLSVT